AVAAGQVAESGGQAGADAVGLEVVGDGGVVDLAAAGAGAEVPLVLGDLGGHRGQLGDLVPGRLGVKGAGVGGQRLLAAAATLRDEGDDLVHAPGGQPPAQVGGVSRLPAGRLAGALLGDGFGRAGGVGRGRNAGVGSV